MYAINRKKDIELIFIHFLFFSFFLFPDLDISVANIVVHDELCRPSSIENSAKNNFGDFVVRHILHGCNDGKLSLGCIQS